MKATTIFERTVSIAIAAMLALTLFATIGCDEGLNMAEEVMRDKPAEVAAPKTPDPAMTGEMKQDPEPETAEPAATTPTPVAEVESNPTEVNPPPTPQQTGGDPVLPGVAPLSEARAREKAYTLVVEELFPLYEEKKYGPEESWGPYAAKEIEVLGLTQSERWLIYTSIRNIHLEERPEDEEARARGETIHLQLLAEYLSLAYQYPEKSQEEILVLFRQAAREGKTIMRWFEAELALGIIDPLYIEAKDIAWTVFDRWAELLQQERSGTLSATEYDEALDKMYAEVTGLAYFNAGYLGLLESVYGQVYPNMDDFVSRESTVAEIIPLIWEFMYVALQNPDTGERQMLRLFEAYIRETPVYALNEEGYPVHAISLTEKRRYQYREATFKN